MAIITLLKLKGGQNKGFLCLMILALAFTGACRDKTSAEDIAGIWSNPDGATLSLYKNGKFKALLPKNIFFPSNRQFPEKVTGAGHWELLKKGWGEREINLHFRELNGIPASYGIPILLPWKTPPPYLFTWVDEEGCARYELTRGQRVVQ
jgi:hypothetical protein